MSDRQWFDTAIKKRNLMVEQYLRDLTDGSKELTARAIIAQKH